MRFPGCLSVLEAEEVGILEALMWTESFLAQSIIVESDAQQGINAINGMVVNLLEQGDVVKHCRSILERKARVMVKYVRKHANKVAHSMARIPCELNSFVNFLSPPLLALETLLDDIR